MNILNVVRNGETHRAITEYTHIKTMCFGVLKIENAKRLFLISVIALFIIMTITMVLCSTIPGSLAWEIPMIITGTGTIMGCLDGYFSVVLNR